MSRDVQIAEITDKLEKGIRDAFQSEQYKTYLNTMSKFHKYSASNTLLISMQKPDATCVAGYQSWKNDFGRHVKAGEKAIKIYAPNPYKKIVEEPILDKNGRPRIALDGSVLTRKKEEYIVKNYKVVNVFDISQTEGRELPKLCKELDGTVERYADFKEAIKRFSPVPIENIPADTKEFGYYSSTNKSIGVREGLSEVQTVKTSLHELTHSKLHDADTGTEATADIRTKEVQAESVAYVVCQHYGIDTSEYSFNYVAAWSSDKDISELKSSMDVIQKTANDIINGIDQKLEEIRMERGEQLNVSKVAEGCEQIENNIADEVNFNIGISR